MILLTGLGGLIIGLIVGFFLGTNSTNAKRNRNRKHVHLVTKKFIAHTQSLRKLEEKKFRAFARRRIKEGKVSKIDEFQFKYNSTKKRAELLEEMYFIAFALRYIEEDKIALIDEFEFKYVHPERQATLLETYRNH